MNQIKQTTSQSEARVAVISKEGEVLMPTQRFGMVRRWIKEGKATIVKHRPVFTIQLCFETSAYKQAMTLGIDTGAKHIGYSVVSAKEEIIGGELKIRQDIKKKLEEKKMHRRARRSRLRYREMRSKNRVGSKKEGWIAPSVRHQVESHMRLINILQQVMPITHTIVEVGNFDPQKMINPEISGIEYQQGTLQGYEVRQYLLQKFHHTCAYCGIQNVPLEVEHIVPRSKGGSDRVDNLTIACVPCNRIKDNADLDQIIPRLERAKVAVKKTVEELISSAKKTIPLESATKMNIIRSQILKQLKERGVSFQLTYGSHTKFHRTNASITKSHHNDAFVIAGGSNQLRKQAILIKQTQRNQRSLTSFQDAQYIDARDGEIRSGRELSNELRQYRKAYATCPRTGAKQKGGWIPTQKRPYRVGERVFISGKIKDLKKKGLKAGMYTVGGFTNQHQKTGGKWYAYAYLTLLHSDGVEVKSVNAKTISVNIMKQAKGSYVV